MASSRRISISSDSSESSTPPNELYDDRDSLTYHGDDSQSSLGASLQEMDLDSEDFEYQCRLSPISRLPAELMIAIFSKISSTADLRHCMLVSKAWARNSVDLLWHRPATHTWPKLHNIIRSARLHDGYFRYNELIKRLNLAQLGDQISDGTVYPLINCKRIERLTLTGCNRLTDLSLASLVQDNRNLLAIDVSGLGAITDRTLFAIADSCFKLQGLNVAKCYKLTDDSLVAVARNCRRVKRLKFNDCSGFTDHAILAFADNCLDLLEIDLHGCVQITDMAVTALIAEGRQLRELRLAQCHRITDEAFLSLPDDQYYESLRVLDLTDCNLLQDAGLQKIVSAAPRLRNLVLAKCRLISDKGVMAITRLGKNLHYIHLGHCNRITDHGVAHLVTFCNRIRYIDLACCVNLTDESVSLLAALPKLKRIGLVKCHNITDKSLRALAKPKPSGGGGLTPSLLERLHLSYCSQLTVGGVRTMLLNCPQLTHLSLTGVNDFLREDLLEFIRPAPDEFNDHQRDVFCVFSGSGVKVLRKHLKENYPEPPSSDIESENDERPEGAIPAPPHHHHHHHHHVHHIPHAHHNPIHHHHHQVVAAHNINHLNHHPLPPPPPALGPMQTIALNTMGYIPPFLPQHHNPGFHFTGLAPLLGTADAPIVLDDGDEDLEDSVVTPGGE